MENAPTDYPTLTKGCSCKDTTHASVGPTPINVNIRVQKRASEDIVMTDLLPVLNQLHELGFTLNGFSLDKW